MRMDRARSGRRLAWPLVAVSVVVALGLFAFFSADGVAYLTDVPEACVNCHVMQPQYSAWQKSGHAAVAVCNDCHTPADPVGKLATKARSGLAHAFAFATGRYADPIRIAPASVAIARASCERCHGGIAESMGHGGVPREERDCLDCHASTGHADSRSTF
ncbi:MAG: cytochrome c nitrite reductase small subunit [Myxococcota bacterium]